MAATATPTTLPVIMTPSSFFSVSTTPLVEGVTTTSDNTLFIPTWAGTVFEQDSTLRDIVCFGGTSTNLPDTNVLSAYGGADGGSDCTMTNGCGVHVHNGTDCTNTTTQGGHWYNSEMLSADPWAIIGYLETDNSGFAEYAHCVHTGYDLVSDPTLLVGRAFIVHGEDGSRVSCGIINEVPADVVKPNVLETETVPIPGAVQPSEDGSVTGTVQVITNIQSAVCYQGYAINLERDVASFLLQTGSDQCDVTNGCGSHIHSGTACDDTEVQGGHYYDADSVAVDPWLLASYLSTDDTGTGAFVGCVVAGTFAAAMEYDAKPFIVHGTDGSRLSCGILSPKAALDEESPTEAPSGAVRGGGTTSTFWFFCLKFLASTTFGLFSLFVWM